MNGRSIREMRAELARVRSKLWAIDQVPARGWLTRLDQIIRITLLMRREGKLLEEIEKRKAML